MNYPCPPVNHMLIQRYHIEKLAHWGVPRKKKNATYQVINQSSYHHVCPDSAVVITPGWYQGDAGSNPAQGNYSFPQKLSSVEFLTTFYIYILSLIHI